MLLRSCAIWRENEREVTVMKQYILDTRMGTIQEEPIQGKMGWMEQKTSKRIRV